MGSTRDKEKGVGRERKGGGVGKGEGGWLWWPLREGTARRGIKNKQ